MMTFCLVALAIFINKVLGSWIFGTINSVMIYGVPIELAFSAKIISTAIDLPLSTMILFYLISNIQVPSYLHDGEKSRW